MGTSNSTTVVQAHLVYPGGPPCADTCPGDWSTWHDGYAYGWEMSERTLAASILKVLPAPPVKVPDWVQGPTRRSWTKEGIAVALSTLGLRRN